MDLLNLVSSSVHDLLGKKFPLHSDDKYLVAAVQWLKRAQDMTKDGGVAAEYSLLFGWRNSYIETTGYILVTFFALFDKTGDREYFTRALKMADFLLKVQLKSGAFQSGTPQDESIPRVFNTGEDIRGLVEAYRRTKNVKYLNGAVKAANWLVSIQEKDGSWIKHAYQGKRHSYHSRTSWALLTVWEETKNVEYRKAARKNLDWVLQQQHKNGWFEECDFTNPPNPYTHAIDYVMSGLLESSKILRDKKLWVSEKKAADALLKYYQKNHFMPATFNRNWKSKDKYCCLTGNAQIVISWMQLYKKTKQGKYLKNAQNLLNDIKKTINLATHDLNVQGAVAGAYPIYGGYDRFAYPNWATKFFIDALLMMKNEDK